MVGKEQEKTYKRPTYFLLVPRVPRVRDASESKVIGIFGYSNKQGDSENKQVCRKFPKQVYWGYWEDSHKEQ